MLGTDLNSSFVLVTVLMAMSNMSGLMSMVIGMGHVSGTNVR